jgi:hypothetical protein
VAVVGDAFIVVRAITTGVEKDIKNAFKGTDRIGQQAGDDVGRSFQKGFRRGGDGKSLFGNLIRQSVAAKEQFSSLTRVGFVLQPVLTALGGIIGLLGTGLLSLGSVISAATAPAFYVLAQSVTAVAQAAITLKLAFSGVGKAIQAGSKAKKTGIDRAKALEKAEDRLTKAQRALADAYEDAATREVKAKKTITDAEKELSKAREQAIEDLQQIGFESEDAAIAEQKAAIELEKARETLARVSDLPPNSRARKEAELAFAQADLNYRKAIDSNNDLKKTEAKNAELAKKGPQALIDGQENVVTALAAVDDATNGYNETLKDNERSILSATEARDDAAEAVKDIEDNVGATDAYADALADLSKEARAFAEYMVNTFIPAIKDLKAAAGENLFPQLETALENFRTKLFPALIPLLKGTGDVIGRIAVKFSEAVTKGENLERLERIWKSNDIVLENFGSAVTSLYENLLILLDNISPLTEEFSAWIAAVTAGWTETLKADEASGKLNERFQIARGILKDLGKIFGNVFGGLGKIISANVGPGSGGQIFLDYLKEVTGRFKNITEIDGRPLKDFFADAAVNGTKLLTLVGNIIGGFITLADNPGLGIFLDQLNVVTDIFQRVGENLDASLPAFGGFLIEFATFIELVTEAGSVTIFFDTLRFVLEKVNEFLASDLGQRLLALSAQVLPFLAAIGLVSKVFGFFVKVVIGSVAQILGPLTAIKTGFVALSTATGIATGPLLLIVGAIAAVIAILVLAYKNSEAFRTALSVMADILKGILMGAFNDIKAAVESVMPTFSGLGEIFGDIGNFLAVTLVPILTVVLGRAFAILSGVIQFLIFRVAGIIDAFKAVWMFVKGILQLLTGNVDGATESFRKSFSSAFSAIRNIIKSILAPLAAIFNAIADAWNNSVGKLSWKVPKWVPFIGGNEISAPKIPRISIASFADGGVVFPQDGGVLARVAEAGKPERIEPLDPNGLSARDKAIIDRLSGPGTTVNITVNPSEGMDERELAAIVSRQIAFATRRGAA